MVVACNTATGIAVESLRSRFAPHPDSGGRAGSNPAALRTRSGVVGVLATTGTVSSENLRAGKHVRGESHSARAGGPRAGRPGEKGELSADATRGLVERYVLPLTQKGADVLVLGCTHYPFLAGLIQEVAGSGVELIDPATAVARELAGVSRRTIFCPRRINKDPSSSGRPVLQTRCSRSSLNSGGSRWRSARCFVDEEHDNAETSIS